MAIYYVDLENGNDSNNGTSFALRKKTLQSAANLVINPGDEIRVMGSRPATPLGPGTWKSKGSTNTNRSGSTFTISGITAANPSVVTTTSAHGLVTGDWVRIAYIGGVPECCGFHPITVINATSFSIPVSNVGYGAYFNQTGNFLTCLTGSVVIMNDPLPITNICWNGTNDGSVENQNFAAIPSADSPKLGTNVGETVARSFRSGDTASQSGNAIVNGYPFGSRFHGTFYSGTSGSGRIGYIPLAQALDLSQYKQISFHLLLNSSGSSSLVSDDYRIQLCSDAAGNNVVNEFIVPGVNALNRWIPFTIPSTTGGFLSSSVQSVRINKTTHRTTVTFCITNIIACKGEDHPQCLSYNSVLYTDRGENDLSKWTIRAILPSYGAIVLDSTLPHRSYNDNISLWRPYNYDENRQFNSPQTPTSQTVMTYVINPIQQHLLSPTLISSSGANIVTSTRSGSVSSSQDNYTKNYITWSGGWNRTDMSTQDGITWITGGHGWGTFMTSGGAVVSYIKYSKFGLIRYNNGIYYNSANNEIYVDDCHFVQTANPIYMTSSMTTKPHYFKNSTFTSTGTGIFFYTAAHNIFVEGCKFYGLYTAPLSCYTGSDLQVKNCYANNCNQIFNFDRMYDVRVENFNAVSIDEASITLTNNIGLNHKYINCNWSSNKTLNFTSTTYYPFNNFSFVRFNEDLTSSDNILSKVDGSPYTYNTLYPIRYWSERKSISFNMSGEDQRTIGGDLLITKDTTTFRTSSPSLKVFAQTVYTNSFVNPKFNVYSRAYPLISVAVTDIGTVTVSMWVWAFSNTTFPFIAVNAPHVGVPNIRTEDYTPAINTWQQLTLSFTPTKKGIVDILFGLRITNSGARYVYVDDISVTQS